MKLKAVKSTLKKGLNTVRYPLHFPTGFLGFFENYLLRCATKSKDVYLPPAKKPLAKYVYVSLR